MALNYERRDLDQILGRNSQVKWLGGPAQVAQRSWEFAVMSLPGWGRVAGAGAACCLLLGPGWNLAAHWLGLVGKYP